ncbi:MAG TPA: Ig-like domain-containing protein, partial [Longimicrobium sp.]|nr:Ig-like domain-containing protein [Longimicrobium sp.]
MPMKRLSPAALLLALAACGGDGPTQRTPTVARVYVTPAETRINVGETTQLSAQGRDEDNVAVAGTTFTWSSLDPGIAGVAADGRVTGLTAGTARVVAAATTGAADTALVAVTAVSTDCTDPGAVPTLAVGDSLTLRGAEASLLCLPGSTAGAEYVVMPFHGTRAQAATVNLTVTAASVRPVTGPPSPSLAPSYAVAGGLAAARGDDGFHTRLSERTRDRLTALVPGARAQARAQGPRMQMLQTTPAVGSLLQVNVSTDADESGDPCVITDFRTGRIEAVSNRAVIVADTANPAGGFTPQDYQNVAATFDTLIYPVNVAAFGEPFDMDQNGRVIIFYTRAVNELTPANVNYIVGGYFYGRDLFPKAAGNGFPACVSSNAGELFYMLAPDPSGTVNGNARSAEYVRNSTLGVVGHEFQHLISASRRLYVVPGVGGGNWNEDAWLNEGLSHIGEELLFYHRAQRSPRMNLGGEIMDQPALASAFNLFQRSNHNRFAQYLLNPDQDSPYDRAFGEEDDLATRGAAWGFLRWLADQRQPAGDQALWYNLVNNNVVGLENLEEVTGGNAVELFRRFAIANYTDDAVGGAASVFSHPSWNYRSLYARVSNGFPLEVMHLSSTTPTSMTLVAGGTAYLRVGVNANQRGSVRLTVANAAPPAAVQVTVVRTR